MADYFIHKTRESILVTKTQLEGTSPQVDNSDDDAGGGVAEKAEAVQGS